MMNKYQLKEVGMLFLMLLLIPVVISTCRSIAEQERVAEAWAWCEQRVMDLHTEHRKDDEYDIGESIEDSGSFGERDPWGRPYMWWMDSEEMSVSSYGPDRQYNTKDDVRVSMKAKPLRVRINAAIEETSESIGKGGGRGFTKGVIEELKNQLESEDNDGDD